MAKRRFTKANINFLSLCPRGVNRLPVIYKSEDKSLNLDTIVKADEHFDDNGELTAVVYAPELRDSEGDIASAKVIKEAMYEAARNGVSIDMRHNEKALPKTSAFIAESFIVQKGDARFDDMKDYHGNKVDVSGAWAVVIKVEDATLRKQYKSGEWNGISMGGTAAVEMEKSEGTVSNIADEVVARLAKILNPSIGKDTNEMTDKELKDVLAANNDTLAEKIATAVAKAVKSGEVTAPVVKEKPEDGKGHVLTAPVLKSEDMLNPAKVKAHQLAVKKHKLALACDFNDDKSVETYLAEIAKLDGTTTEAVVEKSDEVKELERQLAEANKRSNQPVGKEDAGAGTENKGTAKVTKEEELFAAGRKLGSTINKSRGFEVTK